MRIVFWRPNLSIHESATIRALASRGVGEVTIVAEGDPESAWQAMWPAPDFGRARVVVRPSEPVLKSLIADSPATSVHLFSGTRAYPMIRRALELGLRTSATIALQMEGPNHDVGWKGCLRLALGRRDCLKLRGRLSVLFAIGERAVRWYRRCGYPHSTVCPYGYFVEPPVTPLAAGTPDEHTRVRLIFLGRCVASKGVDVLLCALGQVQRPDWELTVMGDGPAKTVWAEIAQQQGLGERVRFLPSQPNPVAMRELSRSDLLVLPSSGKEGWGAVINEALMLGVPAICSDRCGASDLLYAPWRGAVFRAGSVSDLRHTLEQWIARGPRTPDLSERIRVWSGRIHGEAAADYLLAVLRASMRGDPRPPAPWLPSLERATDEIAS
jgi:glycosyltransferase involved in cell wall biosynthesis